MSSPKATYEKLNTTTVNGEKLQPHPLRSGELGSSQNNQAPKNKRHQYWKGGGKIISD